MYLVAFFLPRALNKDKELFECQTIISRVQNELWKKKKSFFRDSKQIHVEKNGLSLLILTEQISGKTQSIIVPPPSLS